MISVTGIGILRRSKADQSNYSLPLDIASAPSIPAAQMPCRSCSTMHSLSMQIHHKLAHVQFHPCCCRGQGLKLPGIDCQPGLASVSNQAGTCAGTEPAGKERRALAAAVTACLAERPIWSLPELQHRLAHSPDAEVTTQTVLGGPAPAGFCCLTHAALALAEHCKRLHAASLLHDSDELAGDSTELMPTDRPHTHSARACRTDCLTSASPAIDGLEQLLLVALGLCHTYLNIIV